MKQRILKKLKLVLLEIRTKSKTSGPQQNFTLKIY